MSRGPVLIMAGGTGGHVFPALALARLLRAASHEVVWLGTRAGLEARVVPAENIDVEFASTHELRNTGIVILSGAPDSGWRVVSWAGLPLGPDDRVPQASGPAGEAVDVTDD